MEPNLSFENPENRVSISVFKSCLIPIRSKRAVEKTPSRRNVFPGIAELEPGGPQIVSSRQFILVQSPNTTGLNSIMNLNTTM